MRNAGFVFGGVVLLFSATATLFACVGDSTVEPGSTSDEAGAGGPGGGDGAPGMTGTPKNPGDKCSPSDSCIGSTCVDGYCCNTACKDTCAACDVPGHVGTCYPAKGPPHGKRACLGDNGGTCAGTCDGVATPDCSYPTASCGAAACSKGLGTAAGVCKMGTCDQPMANCLDKLCTGTTCGGVLQVATGNGFACALLSDNTVRCWGANGAGQLGLGPGDLKDHDTPVAVPGLANVAAIAAADSEACAVLKTGNVMCWGSNAAHTLGLGDNPNLADDTPHATPALVCASGTAGTCVPFTGATTMSMGADETCVISGVHVYCWGDNYNGKLGTTFVALGNTVTNPVEVCNNQTCSDGLHLGDQGGAPLEVTIGADHVCALQNQNVMCWGDNSSGQIGLPLATARAVGPVAVAGVNIGLQKPIHIAATGYGTAALIADATPANNVVRVWGLGVDGSRGACGSAPDDNTITTVGKGPLCIAFTGATSIGAGGGGTNGSGICAVVAGAVWCWGDNALGELGGAAPVGTAKQAYAAATGITMGAVGVFSAPASATFCATLNMNGALRCWGYEKNGDLGNGVPDAGGITLPVAQVW